MLDKKKPKQLTSKEELLIKMRSEWCRQDLAGKNYLSPQELNEFFMYIRKSFYLKDLSPHMSEYICQIIDRKNTKKYTWRNFKKNLRRVMMTLQIPIPSTVSLIKKCFYDFDTKNEGYLEKFELRLLFNSFSDMLHKERLDDWQIDY